MRGELFRAHAHIRARGANFFVHRTQPRADFETNDTSAGTDADQRETTITNARPQTATIETTITSATEKHTQNAHFSPAKAMSVSVGAEPARAKATPVSGPRAHERAKATAVSRERFVMPAGYGGAWPGFETTRRAKLAARTASGRAAAHGHTKQTGTNRCSSRQPEIWRHVTQKVVAPRKTWGPPLMRSLA